MSRALIEYPMVRPEMSEDGLRLGIRLSTLSGLGVFLVCAAELQKIEGRDFAGVLAPLPLTLEPATPG